VLDIGGVTGYSAAILAQLCGKVEALEATEALADGMKQCLHKERISGVSVHVGPLNQGLGALKPFDLIVVNGGASEEPVELFAQLAEEGRLVAIIRQGWLGRAYLFEKTGGHVAGRALFDAGADLLPGFEAQPQFVF
jgi:protein-L-isoaspartate(D-aspartate) O-methyltransferase